MRRFKFHGRGTASLERFHPSVETHTPAISRLEPRKLKLRIGCHQVIPPGATEEQKSFRHLDTNDMQTVITRAGMTFPVTIKTRQRVGATGFEGGPQHITGCLLGLIHEQGLRCLSWPGIATP